MNEYANHAWQAIGDRDLARTKHGNEPPPHLTSALRRKGGGEIIRHGENSTGNIFRTHSFVLGQNLFEQLARRLKDKIRLIDRYCRCSTNSTDWHTLLLNPHPVPLSLLRGGGEEEG